MNWKRLGLLLLVVLAVAYGVASVPWDRSPSGTPVRVSQTKVLEAEGKGPFLASAARIEVHPPFPVVAGGYAPPRSLLQRSELPSYVRAVVLSLGTLRMGWVVIESVTAPQSLQAAIRARVQSLGLETVWLTATHTHTGMGGYDEGWVSQVAGTGRYRADVFQTWVDASAQALDAAATSLQPATVESATLTLSGWAEPRTGSAVDARGLALRFLSQQRKPLAQWVVVAAHPTLEPRRTSTMSGDYPARWALEEEAQQGGVVFILQGAGANASVAHGASVAQAAEKGRAAVSHASWKAEPISFFALTSVRAPLPGVDASRLVPWPFRGLVENLLRHDIRDSVVIERLDLGPWSFLGVPGEVTKEAGRQLEQAAAVTQVVSVTNGYVGYVEPAEVVESHTGEARRQYFVPALLEGWVQAAALTR